MDDDNKRRHSQVDADGASSDSESDYGPALPAPQKKRRKLPFEKTYLSALPQGKRYSKSLMHRDQLSYITLTPHTDFLITASVDGFVKFWKKQAVGIEFVKEFRAHPGEITGVSTSADGRAFASCGDNTVKIWDVISFDLLSILTLDFNPRRVCWVHRGGASLPLLAVTDANSSRISIYDGRGGNTQPLSSNNSVHRKPVNCLSFNNTCNCVVSADDSGMIEYWDPASFEKPDSVFELKTRTDLFAFKKTKSVPSSITMSPTGEQLATFSFPDRQVRIFDFASGKLYRSYDESLATVTTMQQAGTALAKLDEVDFGRRIAIERNLDNPTISPRINVLFDESGHFVLYGSLLGIKCINTFTNRVVRLYGRDEPFRPLNLVLYQGAPQQKGLVTVDMAASANPLLQEAGQRDPLLAATAVGKVRFYLFTNEAASGPPPKNRDVFNEKPTTADGGTDAAAAATAAEAARQAAEASTSAVLHTTMGDITLRLFPAHAPKTVRNFTGHATSGYYNNTRFHRVIPKFMIQGGDPLGDGTGGESIWGGEFEDEISDLKHDRPYTLSMANAGPNTNASQFFITTERTPWLDGRHTIFGRVVRGMDVVKRIENVRTIKERPEEDVRIVSISVGGST